MTKTRSIKHYLRVIPRIFVGLILVSTGIGKALDMPGFVTILDSYQLLPIWLSVVLAYFLPFLELGIGISLLIAFKRLLTACLAVTIHILMLSVVLITLYRGIDVANCGCFGVFFARPLTPVTAIEDIVMLIMSVLALLDAQARR